LLVTLLKDAAIDRRFKLYLSAYSSYVGLDTNNMLSVKKLFGGTERCGLLGGDGKIDKSRCNVIDWMIFNQDKNLLCNGSGECSCRPNDPFSKDGPFNLCEQGSIPTCFTYGERNYCYCNGSGL
jgi:hypothetical protein